MVGNKTILWEHIVIHVFNCSERGGGGGGGGGGMMK